MIHCPFNFGAYLEDYKILLCHPKGELTTDRMSDIAVCRDCIQKAGLTQVNRFHNLTDIKAVNIGFDEVYKVCDVESKYRDPSKPINACYLVPNPLLFGTMRMYQTLIESCGVEVHVSYDINQLSSILGVKNSVLVSGQVA